jgi:1-phosphatidylinositol-3-phosphate 5-kinase
VVDSAELLFTEVLNALHQISEKRPITGSFDGNIKILELRRNIVELEDILQAEKADFTVICLSIALLRNHCHTYAW